MQKVYSVCPLSSATGQKIPQVRVLFSRIFRLVMIGFFWIETSRIMMTDAANNNDHRQTTQSTSDLQ